MTTKQDLLKEAEECWNFNNSHNIMTSQPKGVMAVSTAKKLFDRSIGLFQLAQKENHLELSKTKLAEDYHNAIMRVGELNDELRNIRDGVSKREGLFYELGFKDAQKETSDKVNLLKSETLTKGKKISREKLGIIIDKIFNSPNKSENSSITKGTLCKDKQVQTGSDTNNQEETK